jgi:hypothetical protein
MTVGNGRVLYRAGEITFLDEQELTRRVTQAAAKLHQSFETRAAFRFQLLACGA